MLVEVSHWLHEAMAGRGRLLFLGGEPGIGKTVLVRRFCQMVAQNVRVLTGACDPLSTPQPLGPLLEIAGQLGSSRLADMLTNSENRHRIFQTVLNEFSAGSQASLVVFEDVHWADEATLDLLRYLGRRIDQASTLLIATYRDDEVGDRHPLRLVLGDLATMSGVRRIGLQTLSLDAVSTLARGSGIDAAELHRKTGGNPFFVSEILAAGREQIPATVRDAVLSRAARLPAHAAPVLEAAAVIGYRIEPWLLDAIAEPPDDSLEACLGSGMLNMQGSHIVFPHELTREAVLAAVSPQHKLVLNRRALEALRNSPSGSMAVARLAHHAEFAGERDAVLEYAPAAASRAAALGAHREAAAQYARALRFADGMAAADRAALLVNYSFECATVDNYDDAIWADHEIIRIWRAEGNRLMEGWGLSFLGACLVMVGQQEADEASRASLEILEALPPGKQLAEAYAWRANLMLQTRECAAAVEYANKALAIARSEGHPMVELNASMRLGGALLFMEDEAGRGVLDGVIRQARELGAHLYGAGAYNNLGTIAGELHEFERADRYLVQGLAYAAEHETDAPGTYMRAWHALVLLYLGRWSEAEDAARHVLRRTSAAAPSRITGGLALGKLLVRRGDAAAREVLDETLGSAQRTGMLQRIAPVRIARAEAAWLDGNSALVREEASAALDQALHHRHRWYAGELLFWLARVGERVEVPDWIARPFALQIAGEWAAAAVEWQHRCCPYEAAAALVETGEENALLSALEEFERLGAKPMTQHTARRLREAGVRGIPRGPRPSTRSNFAQLTQRELEVLELLADGLSNAQIATRLYLSPKTVGHHVSAVLSKLGVPARTAAVHEAERLGLLSQNREARKPN